MLDLLIINATLPDGRTGMSVAVERGRIVEVTQGLTASAYETVDAAGQLLYAAAHICVNSFATAFVRRIVGAVADRMPMHVAHKSIAALQAEMEPVLLPTNPEYRSIEIKEGMRFEIWGVVTGSFRRFN